MTAKKSVLRLVRKLAAAGALVVPLGACFNYSTVSLETLAPDQTARFTLDQEGFGRVVNEAAVGGFPVQSMNLSNNRISGRVSEVGEDGPTVQLRGAGGSLFTTQLARGSIQEVAVREFDRNNTLLAAGGIVVIVGAMLQGGATGGASGQPQPPETENMIGLRLFSVTVP